MNTSAYVPCTKNDAGLIVRLSLNESVHDFSREEFINVWHSIAYLHPGLHPDDYDDPDSGWPRALERFAAEAWRRFEAGELTEAELYPVDAAWSSVYDSLARPPTADESRRRTVIAALHGLPLSAE